MRDFKLTAIRYAGHQVNSFEFTPIDRNGVVHAGPGSHIDLEVRPDLLRQYSLIALRDDAYEIGVQLEGASRGASRHLHERARVGDVFRIGDVRNHFQLDEATGHSLFIAGGVGVVPMIPMIERLSETGSSWELHMAARHRDGPFRDRLARFGARVRFAIREAPGYRRLEIHRLVADAPENATFYCCGPDSMLRDFAQAIKGVPEERVRVEHFAPAAPAAAEGGYSVVLARSGVEIAVQLGQTILDALSERDFNVPNSCRQGICGACETAVLYGVPDHRDGILSDSERATNRTMMICCSGSLTARIVLDR